MGSGVINTRTPKEMGFGKKFLRFIFAMLEVFPDLICFMLPGQVAYIGTVPKAGM